MLLEICANSYQSAINAEQAGAHRIELCTELAVGGITPSYGLIKKVLKDISIPVFILIRPRSGNFTYSDKEFQIMKEDIVLCKELGCAGIVSGILNPDNSIDIERTKELADLSKPLAFTFHRAFDWVADPLYEIEQLAALGVHRILSSGQETSAVKGIALLKELQNKTSITILPGGGINAQNAFEFKKAGFSEIHASASKVIETATLAKISMNSANLLSDTELSYADKQNIINILKSVRDV